MFIPTIPDLDLVGKLPRSVFVASEYAATISKFMIDDHASRLTTIGCR